MFFINIMAISFGILINSKASPGRFLLIWNQKKSKYYEMGVKGSKTGGRVP